MNKDKLLKISEFADMAGISKQTVYNHIQSNRKNLTEYIQKIDEVVFIKESALFLYKKVGQKDSKLDSNLNQLDSKNESNLNQLDSNFESFLMGQIAEKDKQIEEKDKQIKKLSELLEQEKQALKDKDKLIEENIKHFQEQEKSWSQLLYNSQVLLKEKNEEKKPNFIKRLFSAKKKDDEK